MNSAVTAWRRVPHGLKRCQRGCGDVVALLYAALGSAGGFEMHGWVSKSPHCGAVLRRRPARPVLAKKMDSTG